MAGFHVMADAYGMHVQPTVRRITTADLWHALKLGEIHAGTKDSSDCRQHHATRRIIVAGTLKCRMQGIN